MLRLRQVLIEQFHLDVGAVDDVLEVFFDGGHVFLFVSEVLLPDEDLLIGVFLESFKEVVVEGLFLLL